MSLSSLPALPARVERVVNTRHGPMLASPLDLYIGNALHSYGEYCEAELRLLAAIAPADRPVVDVGANIGCHTIPLARMVPSRQLFAFEPQPEVFAILSENVALNQLHNVHLFPFACGRKSGACYFDPPHYQSEGNFGGVRMRADGRAEAEATATRVECLALDAVPGLHDAGMVKIDVEGAERDVLVGAAALIERSRPILYLENDRPQRSQDLIEWLWSRRYRLWWHLPPLFNRSNFFGNEQDLFPGLVSINMLALPAEKGGYTASELREVTSSSQHPASGFNA